MLLFAPVSDCFFQMRRAHEFVALVPCLLVYFLVAEFVLELFNSLVGGFLAARFCGCRGFAGRKELEFVVIK